MKDLNGNNYGIKFLIKFNCYFWKIIFNFFNCNIFILVNLINLLLLNNNGWEGWIGWLKKLVCV